jgi:hypothetical protein
MTQIKDQDLKPRILVGYPSTNVKGKPRADMRPALIDGIIGNMGYNVWWSRAAICPCRQNDQTGQPRLTCTLCKGSGWHFYLPEVGLENFLKDADGNEIILNEARDAVMIQAAMTAATQDPQVYERFGQFVFGTFRVTVNARNRLGYRDRIILADSLMMFGQLLEADGTDTIQVKSAVAGQKALWYRPITVNLLRSEAHLFVEMRDWQIEADGSIRWLIAPPTKGTFLSCNYEINPVYRVMDHVHAVRDTNVLKNATSKRDEHKFLPVNAMMKLDFLLEGSGE